MKPIKILTYTSLFPNTAQPRHGIFVENRLRHLVESGHVSVKVVAPVPWFPFKGKMFGAYATFSDAPRQETRHGMEVFHPRYLVLPKVGMSVAPWLMAKATTAMLDKMIREGFDFDVIDAHYFYPDGVAAAMLAKRFGKPLVITARGTDINLIPQYAIPRRWINWAASQASAMISVCNALKDEMVEIGIPAEKITALRNGVDLNFFRPGDRDQIRSRLGLTGKTLLSAGYLIERKGHHLIIEALAALPEMTLCIAGDGEMLGALQNMARDQGVTNRVRFLGALDREALRDYMIAADALVLASSREGMANVLLESLACGTPVVATPLWGTPEVVAAPEAGVLTPDRSAAGIVQGVKQLFLSYPEREATRRYAEGFSWDETTQGQLEIFRRVAV